MAATRNEQLVTRRKSRNLSQKQVAKAVGISARNYQYLEAGEHAPNAETAISIAELLRCEVPDLFGASRRQPGDNDTQPDYSNLSSKGIEDAKELESAAKDFSLDVEAIADILADGLLNEAPGRNAAMRLFRALGRVLGDAA
jgi:DNA-binding XRE family transcriptional regulator